MLGRRDDGYHSIKSLLQCVGLYDTLTFEASDSLEIISDADIPVKDNLVYKAALSLREAAGVEHGARIRLEKNIPLSSGLGGGSSDAACALKGLRRLWAVDISDGELAAAAAALGSDVPFFLGGHAALLSGRGERVGGVSVGSPYTLLLCKPPYGISAGWAYGQVKQYSVAGHEDGEFVRALNDGDISALGAMARNGLEGGVFGRHPEVEGLKRAMLGHGARLSLMSGSGSTVFGLFDSAWAAEDAATAMKPHWWAVVQTLI